MTQREIFLAALDLPDPAARAAYLDEACGGDTLLRGKVEALLRSHEDAGSFLNRSPVALGQANDPALSQDRPATTTGAFAPGREGAPPRLAKAPEYPPSFEPGTVIAGRYTLQEKIGEGGMGEVWVARQTEPVKRKVAVKLIKAGMDSKAVVARFEAERQALALMDHPSIARVLDGGLTEGRRPFFVMELVNGLPLTRFCDEAKLTPRARLELFIPVCQAVQHAHQKGIVHRDLKPSNILVTLYDGKPVPKVIDFGVAKATGDKLTEVSVSTQFGAVIGTLEYMAPEQAGFSAVDVDTRADIYSLGVILYELLTGLKPFDGNRLRRAALDDLIRILREEEPSRPSTRLSTDASLPTLAELRQTEPKKLMALMRGELDWVVMKCLEKQRERRYETASGLARDVQRYLGDEPVEARPPSAGYRLGKFLRRNRGPALAAVAVTAALVLGTVAATTQAVRATRAEAAAVAEARTATLARQEAELNFNLATKTVNQFVTRVKEHPRLQDEASVDLRKALLHSTVPFFEHFAAARSDDPAQEFVRGRMQERLAVVRYQMGEREAALAGFEAAGAVYARLAADFPANTAYRMRLAFNCDNLALVMKALGRPPEAATAIRQALAIRERLAAEFPHDAEHRKFLAKCHSDLGSLLLERGKPAQSEAAFRQALTIQEKLAADAPAVPQYALDLGGTYVALGRLARERGESAAALDWLGRATPRLQAVLEQAPRELRARQLLRNAHWERARALGQLGRHAEAVRDWELAVARNDERHLDGGLRLQRATSLARAGRPAEAVAAVEALLEPPPPDAGMLYDAACVFSLTAGLAKAGPAKAENHAARAVALLRQAVQRKDEDIARLSKDPALDPVRHREDFQAVLRDLQKAKATPGR